jgi:NADH:ubiquinone oxidoreductase subunit K
MIDASLLLFLPTLFALIALATRRNIYCLYIAIMVWLQSVIVTAANRSIFSDIDRYRITFVCLFVLVLSFAVVLSFLIRKRRRQK